MAADLTVDNLVNALRFFFKQIVENPDAPVDKDKGLVLFGTPGDDDMRSLMEAFGGTIKITVKEMPLAMQQTFPPEVAGGQGAVVWSPSEDESLRQANAQLETAQG